MNRPTLATGLGIVMLIAACDVDAPDDSRNANVKAVVSTTTIPMRIFSASPSLGAKPTSVSDRKDPNYGALMVFFDKVTAYTEGTVSFSMTSWVPSAPNSIIQQVGINDDPSPLGVPRDASFDSGSALNPVWGFVYNSTPFGLDFDLMMRFLYDEGGLALAQSIVDARGLNVKLLPVVGSPPQVAGYFKHPIGPAKCQGDHDCKNEAPIGLEGLCQAGWVFRYLPPAQDVLDRACDRLIADGVIESKSIGFVASIPGQTMLGAIQQGLITAFEFATALDDYDPPPAGAGFFTPLPPQGPVPLSLQNPGHKGLRFAHFPAWHQPFFVGWVMLNKASIWNALTAAQQDSLEHAARAALAESHSSSKSLQCKALKDILKHNDGQVQLQPDGTPVIVGGKTISADMKTVDWPDAALDRLKVAAEEHFESLKGGANPTADQSDYAVVLAALRAFMERIDYTWDPKDFDDRGGCGI